MVTQTKSNPVLVCGHCQEYEQVSRRGFLLGGLKSVGAALGGPVIAMPTWMPRVTLAPPHVGPKGDTLVVVFLRGGADGLNIVVPHGDDAYYAHRPTIAIPRPDDRKAEHRALDLDGFFGLHPALAPLADLYRAGLAAFIHATGAPDETRSHFEAMAFMERGAVATGEYSGWLARHLSTLDTGNPSVLRAVAVGEILQASLTGAVSATALQSIADYHLNGRPEARDSMKALLGSLYEQGESLTAATASQTLESLRVLEKVWQQAYHPAGRAYPQTGFGEGMKMIAQLVKARVGVESACIDLGGWDTHAAQGTGEGMMAKTLQELGTGLAAFVEDMGTEMGDVTVVVMSEFGRRVQENGALGTDHGHGNMMMVLGGGINGGKVYARWPGLAVEQLTGPGDLVLTTDYRDVLGEVIRMRLRNPRVGDIFPDYAFNEVGIARERG